MTRSHAAKPGSRGGAGPRIRLQGAGRRYGLRGPWVLRGIDLEVPAGALLRIDGVNGSGKSTLLRLLAGLDAPSEGRVTGRPRTAYVPERFPARLPFTAEGYLIHLGRVHGLSREAAARGAAGWMERFGAGEHLRTPLSELSKGSSQKVAVSQALLAAPDLLLLDEAWTGLDAAARAELDGAVLERRAAGCSVVFVDHDPRRLAGLSDATYTVAGGALRRCAGAPAAPSVGIVALAPPGTDPAAGPPTAPFPVAPGPSGAVRLTVPATDSDAVLRDLLTTRPAWHVVSVTPLPTPADTAPRTGGPRVPAPPDATAAPDSCAAPVRPVPPPAAPVRPAPPPAAPPPASAPHAGPPPGTPSRVSGSADGGTA
ncbi:hypothetical protein GCM10018793_50940 [Streptomyces sulfonofaciens]|uniref:ABC transporter domain-containing protein n=1 Tax=Streptomyces sulfonofaciens TaxID=68272 RepID=A0A919GJ46_9ACTN|nr:ATP-binding cassette domain-containing protein [Streptomyces sulfonofaciens]GHH84916.1 hypothetical protein GCM10018793_50940 [Streptomyces sulfonofaciens]